MPVDDEVFGMLHPAKQRMTADTPYLDSRLLHDFECSVVLRVELVIDEKTNFDPTFLRIRQRFEDPREFAQRQPLRFRLAGIKLGNIDGPFGVLKHFYPN